MKAKLIGYGLASLVSLGAIGGVWLHGNSHGVKKTQAAHQAALERVRQDQARMADQLETATRERDRLRQQQVRTIYLEPDPSGCADAPALPGLLDSLRGPG